MTDQPQLELLASQVVAALQRQRQTVAVAESLTGGLLSAYLTGVSGASTVFRGGLIPYASDLKATLVGVEPSLLARSAVQPAVAEQLADGVRRRLGAQIGLATTGVAGPDRQDGQPVGTAWVGWASTSAVGAVALPPATWPLDAVEQVGIGRSLPTRQAIRRAVCELALVTLLDRLDRLDRLADEDRPG